MAYNKKLLYVSEAPVWITESGSFGSFLQNGSPISNINLSAAEFFNDVITYSVTSGSLPTGLSLNSSTGVISGTISGYLNTQTIEISITATDSEGETAVRDFSFDVIVQYDINYLAVAGGGGTGTRHSGGGGAGGYIESVFQNITSGTLFSISIGNGGAGGVGATENEAPGQNGGNTTISTSSFTITAIGGGAGSTYFNSGAAGASYSGGSGGGAPYSGSQGAGTPGQGNPGGDDGAPYSKVAGGGGGGATQPGSNPSSVQHGGAGYLSTITGSNVYFAGGGGGSQWDKPGSASAGNGGIGGGGGGGSANNPGPAPSAGLGGTGGLNNGGDGNQAVSGGDATGGNGGANTGGGAGGSGQGSYGTYAYNDNAANGGSGVAILRMPTFNYSGTTTGSPTVTTDGSDTILIYTGSGTYTS